VNFKGDQSQIGQTLRSDIEAKDRTPPLAIYFQETNLISMRLDYPLGNVAISGPVKYPNGRCSVKIHVVFQLTDSPAATFHGQLSQKVQLCKGEDGRR